MKGLERQEPVYLEKFDIHVTPYLTSAQQKKIVELMLETDDLFEQDVILMVGVLAACTDIPDDVELDYDTIVACGLWDAVWTEIDEYVWKIKDAVEKYTSIEYTFTKLCDKISDGINKLTDALPTESNLVEIAEKLLKEQENGK